MKNQLKVWMMGLFVANLLFLASCDNYDEPEATPSAREVTYALAPLSNSGVSGTVTFLKQDSSTLVTIQLTGTQSGNSHPAHIHNNNASAGGAIALDFNPVDGATGRSETMVTALNNGTPVTYEELVNFNGHVNIHKSESELAIMIAQGNIGSNATPTPPDNGGNGY